MADSRIAYGLAKKHGIDTTGMSPQQVWDALKEKGISLGTDREADKEQLAQKYSDSGSDKRQPPVAKGFNRLDTAHHRKHAAEMGLNEKQYAKAAEEFFNNNRGDVFYSLVRKRFYKYDRKTHMMCVVSSSGDIHTYMEVAEKRFSKITKQDKLEKL